MIAVLTEARAKLREQLNWRGPSGKAHSIITLSREHAEAILAGSAEPATEANTKLTCACGNTAMHKVWKKSGTIAYCCSCYVRNGNPPVDWHYECMETYAAMLTPKP